MTSEAIKAALGSLAKTADQGLFLPPLTRRIPTGYRKLDTLIGGAANPGLPTGRFIEVLGQEGAGKTTLAYAFCEAIINQPGGKIHPIIENGRITKVEPPRRVLYLDFEHALDIDYTRNAITGSVLAIPGADGTIGKNMMQQANLWIHQPMSLEEGSNFVIELSKTREFGLIVVDSVPAMGPVAERDQGMEKDTVGLQARAVGKLFRKSIPFIGRYGVCVVLINQWRTKIGVAFGDPREAPGGKALRFYSSVRLDVMGSKKQPYFKSGKECKIKSLKNKVSGELGEAVYYIERGYGISKEIELAEAMLECGAMTCNPRRRNDKYTIETARGKLPLASLEGFVKICREEPKRMQTMWQLVEQATNSN